MFAVLRPRRRVLFLGRDGGFIVDLLAISGLLLIYAAIAFGVRYANREPDYNRKNMDKAQQEADQDRRGAVGFLAVVSPIVIFFALGIGNVVEDMFGFSVSLLACLAVFVIWIVVMIRSRGGALLSLCGYSILALLLLGVVDKIIS